MTDEQKQQIIAQTWKIHALVEQGYVAATASKGDKLWREKQRILLADMTLHLLQTALDPAQLDEIKLKNNLYSILTISEQFRPQTALSQARDSLVSSCGLY
jgi:hypothetical protein